MVDKDKNQYIVKVANTSDKAQSIQLTFDGMKKKAALTAGRCIKLASPDLDKDNSLDAPSAIVPQESALTVEAQGARVEIEPNTFAVYIFEL